MVSIGNPSPVSIRTSCWYSPDDRASFDVDVEFLDNDLLDRITEARIIGQGIDKQLHRWERGYHIDINEGQGDNEVDRLDPGDEFELIFTYQESSGKRDMGELRFTVTVPNYPRETFQVNIPSEILPGQDLTLSWSLLEGIDRVEVWCARIYDDWWDWGNGYHLDPTVTTITLPGSRFVEGGRYQIQIRQRIDTGHHQRGYSVFSHRFEIPEAE